MYLFTPPLTQRTNVLVGSLRCTFQVAQTVWKDGDGWRAQECPSDDVLVAAVAGGGRVLAVTGRPQFVDDATAAELLASGVGGTLAHVTIEGDAG